MLANRRASVRETVAWVEANWGPQMNANKRKSEKMVFVLIGVHLRTHFDIGTPSLGSSSNQEITL
jgi:hypothetical protein